MTFDFPLILLSLIVFSGFVCLADFVFCLVRGEKLFEHKKRPLIIEYARSFFPVLLLVFCIRSFLFQPYRVPTGSLKPTVMPGDFIFVNQYHYGVRFPVWDKKIITVSEPARGQIALFYYPVDHHFTFVKRVIGLPGDKISYINKVLYINGQEVKQTYLGEVTQFNDFGELVTYQEYEEDLNGVKHHIFEINDANHPVENFYNVVVPKDSYFMMGDNRDESDDSRYWGVVPEKDLVGHALFIWLSWDANATHFYDYIRWNRIGHTL